MKELLSMDYQKAWVRLNCQRIADEKRKIKVSVTVMISWSDDILYSTGEEAVARDKATATLNEKKAS